jgi:hypothetical protein
MGSACWGEPRSERRDARSSQGANGSEANALTISGSTFSSEVGTGSCEEKRVKAKNLKPGSHSITTDQL